MTAVTVVERTVAIRGPDRPRPISDRRLGSVIEPINFIRTQYGAVVETDGRDQFLLGRQSIPFKLCLLERRACDATIGVGSRSNEDVRPGWKCYYQLGGVHRVDMSVMAASFDDTPATEKPRSLWSAAGDEQTKASAGESAP
jgi:hypothetical protein